MATKIARKLMKIFGSSAPTGAVGTGQISKFGSYAAGSSATSTDPSVIQSLSQWIDGWFSAVVGSNVIVEEDLNAIHYVETYQIASIFQDGVPTYESSTVYFYGSLVNNGSGIIFVCINDNSGAGISGEALSNGTYWSVASASAGNSLLNGAFDYFQRGFSVAVPYNAGAAFTYLADRWATACYGIGTAGVITMSQQTPSVKGSGAALQVAVTTTGAGPLGAQLFHFLDVNDSLPYYGGFGSFGAYFKAIGNVTQLQLQFAYNTTSSSVAGNFVTLGAAVTVNVNSATPTLGSIIAQAMGTTQTLVGVVGVVITVSAVSSGYVYTAGNGFQIEQAIMVPNSILPPFKRAHTSTASEFNALQAYFEKNFDMNIAPADAVASNVYITWYAVGTAGANYMFSFKVPKRIDPTVNFYNPFASAANKIRNLTESTNLAMTLPLITQNGIIFGPTTGYSNADQLTTTLAADAEIY
jgi:hypothetical protein